MDIFFWIILAAGGILSFLIGRAFSQLSQKVRDRKLQGDGKDFLLGKRQNILKLDGEDININKFIVRDFDGESKVIEIVPEEQEAPLLKISPVSFFGKLKSLFKKHNKDNKEVQEYSKREEKSRQKPQKR